MSKKDTIIIIEDDKDMAEIFEEWAKSANISVVGVGYDGREAVGLFEKHRPEIIVLDLMMPYFDGFYAIDKIRKIDPSAKFLVLTADITDATKKKLEQMKEISLMYKPYDLDDVINEIKKLANIQPAV
ncbi:response regulator [Candidatus Nitrosotenuis chungbukensis]|uniref:response regulator n=1 Tax=Candidatus Nitrosotenuis chungbukensis TaxID=1353246 RepID=UPI0005B26F3A|nr:response regulator [Candidatus Nitrosotenuis chungbukensis]WKT57486.1 response regulator [Candidatus Nitrosotenuis chungbukensis]